MNEMKVAAIIPAYNEEKNIAEVLKTLLKSPEIDEIIVVDDGSKDKTTEISEKLGVKVIRSAGNQGKGRAMQEGLKATQAGIIVFFDADLIGLQPVHVSSLVRPVLENKAQMAVGIRERGGWKGKFATFLIKIDSLSAVAGERALKRFIFESLPQSFIEGFAVETGLNYFCLKKKLKVAYVHLKGLDITIKEKKWGFWKGFSNRLKMLWQLLKIRMIILFSRKEFK
ncbi:MAG TPA: glycosyltransferase family 2 protein [Patescibacteria group bacterium]|nr:glycosyltransferase family 2 protein [Patescibacteria group bacterium]